MFKEDEARKEQGAGRRNYATYRVFAAPDLGQQPVRAKSSQHSQRKHQYHTESVGYPIGLDQGDIVQHNKGQRNVDQ